MSIEVQAAIQRAKMRRAEESNNPDKLAEEALVKVSRLISKISDIKEEMATIPEKIVGKDGVQGEKGNPGKDGKDGEDGITPIKGIDYFDGLNGKDGKPGKNGLNGKDGKDGKNGRDGIDGKDGSSDTPEDIKDKLSALRGKNRLDAKHIQNIDKYVSLSVTQVGGSSSGGSYTLPKASATALGGIMVGDRLSIDGNGVLSADVQTGATGVQSVVAGTDIAVDNTDSENPIVSFSGTIPTATSDLTNDSGFIASGDIPAIPEDVSDLTDTTGLLGNALKIQGFDVTETDPSDGKILVYRTATSEYVLEDKPAAGANPSAADVSFTPGGEVSSINVQDAVIELDTEKISKSLAIAYSVTF